MVIISLFLLVLIHLFYTIVKMNLIINYITLLDITLNNYLFIYVIINLNFLFYKL